MWVGPNNAEDVFAEYIARCQAGELVELREYTERWPEIADRLRELEVEWRRVARILRRAAHGQSPSESAATERGGNGEPRTAVEREPDAAAEAGLHAVLASIRGRAGANERYRVEEPIGEGGMGIVMRVWDVELKRNVAMKVIKSADEKIGWPGFEGVTSRVVSRFIEEAQITSQLDHPGIVPVHEMGIDEQGRLYFTMRLVRGQSLKQVFESDTREVDGWNRTRLLGVLLKACEALAYAHDKGVVHRDLKPSNIMVGRFGEVYVMDWGLARPLHAPDLHELDLHGLELHVDHNPASTQIRSDLRGSDSSPSPGVTHDGDILGTAEYMPPEQARSALSQIGKHSDVYSMGAVLYHLLCGSSPYQEGDTRLNRQEVLFRLLAGPPRAIEQRATDAPPELLAICRKAMLREPEQRYATMLEFAEDLRAFLEHRVVRAYRTGAWAELSTWLTRNRALAATLAVAAAVIVGGTAFFLVQLGHEVDQKQSAFDALEKRTLERDRQNHRLQARELIALADALYPTTPASVPRMRRWLDDVAAFETAVRVHEPSRAHIGADNAVLARELGELAAAVEQLRTVRADVEQRVERASSLERRSLIEHADEWSQAIARIEDSGLYRDPNGDGLKIVPQLGLVPLGPSPNSELEEFWVVDSGAEPRTRAENGEWQVGATTGIVFVLLPGESDFTLGADNFRLGTGGPACAVALHPFFAGKYEVTQGQWFAVMGDRPSAMSVDHPRTISGAPDQPPIRFDDSYPVESVSWFDASRFAMHLDLRLLFEAQWEYAARARTATLYWTGDNAHSVIGAENIHDNAVVEVGEPPPPAQDGFELIAPVGSLRANPFGLFDVHGNVSEWCRDVHHFEFGGDRRTRGDGARADFDAENASEDRRIERTARGGNYVRVPQSATTSSRGGMQASIWNQGTGARVARPLWPCPWCAPGSMRHE